MRNSLLSAVGVCALCTGFAHSRPPEAGVNPNGVSRTTEPPVLTTPAAALGWRTDLPGPTDCRVARLAPPLVQLTQPDTNPRSAYPQTSAHPEITTRSLSSSVTISRDPSMFLIQPGEKGNKLPESVPGRNLSPALTAPKTVASDGIISSRRFGDIPAPQRTFP